MPDSESIYIRTYAVAYFGVTPPRFLPAAAWYVPTFRVRFFRATRGKTAHDWKGAHRSAEGTTSQLCKSYYYRSQELRGGILTRPI